MQGCCGWRPSRRPPCSRQGIVALFLLHAGDRPRFPVRRVRRLARRYSWPPRSTRAPTLPAHLRRVTAVREAVTDPALLPALRYGRCAHGRPGSDHDGRRAQQARSCGGSRPGQHRCSKLSSSACQRHRRTRSGEFLLEASRVEGGGLRRERDLISRFHDAGRVSGRDSPLSSYGLPHQVPHVGGAGRIPDRDHGPELYTGTHEFAAGLKPEGCELTDVWVAWLLLGGWGGMRSSTPF